MTRTRLQEQEQGLDSDELLGSAAPKADPVTRLVYSTLDAWRGIAALGVVMTHACLPTIATRFPELRFRPLYSFSLLGRLGVQLFFVISGFCIANAAMGCVGPGGTRRFLIARIRRIYPPYFFASLCAASLPLLAQWMIHHQFLTTSAIAESTPLGHGALYYFAALTLTQMPLGQPTLIAIFWTLCYEVAFYLIVLLFLASTAVYSMSRRTLLTFLHIVTLSSLVALILAPASVIFPFNLWPQFGLGVLTYDLLALGWTKRSILLSSAILGAFAILASLHSLGGALGHASTRIQSVTCVLFCALLLVLYPFDAVLRRRHLVKWLSFVGLFSYSLYLIHVLAIGVAAQICRKANETAATFVYGFFFRIIVAIFAGYGFYLLFERPFISRRSKIRVTATLQGSSVM